MAKKSVLQVWMDTRGEAWMEKRRKTEARPHRTLEAELAAAAGISSLSVHRCAAGRLTGTLVAAALEKVTGADFKGLTNVE